PNSLVFIDACHSAGDDAFEFRGACLNAGASAYLGWSDSEVIRDGVGSAAYLFDRLLGANHFDDKETPPQRAFSLTEMLNEMHKRNRQYTDTTYDRSLNPKTGI